MGYWITVIEKLGAYRAVTYDDTSHTCKYCMDQGHSIVEEIAGPHIMPCLYTVCKQHFLIKMIQLKLQGFQALPLSLEITEE